MCICHRFCILNNLSKIQHISDKSITVNTIFYFFQWHSESKSQNIFSKPMAWTLYTVKSTFTVYLSYIHLSIHPSIYTYVYIKREKKIFNRRKTTRVWLRRHTWVPESAWLLKAVCHVRLQCSPHKPNRGDVSEMKSWKIPPLLTIQKLIKQPPMEISMRVAVFSLPGESNFWSSLSWCLPAGMKVGDKKQNCHKHSELIIFSNKQGFSRPENKRENKLHKEQEWIGKHVLESLGAVAFRLSLALMLYLYCLWEGGKLAVGKREANWTKSPPEVFLVG